ncbi:hypothetical protein M9H77_14238 [Catharanthus roseus]|uniref:Uncharacterized protein n=1 Tax=Catharanthus roseus TaxID=4058 RepID=A0ACC0BMN2_CATRO|nr:hypothetical protein M9H77_14238 [Catharanthus roseus]
MRSSWIENLMHIICKSTPTADGILAPIVTDRPLDGNSLKANTLPRLVGSTLPSPLLVKDLRKITVSISLPYPPSKPLAIGVVYRDQRGGFHHAMLRDKGEVLLSARALGSLYAMIRSNGFPDQSYS